MNFSRYILFALLTGALGANAQDSLLTKQSAVDIALENNYDIKVSNNDLEAAKKEVTNTN